jgi:hypothetical protein
MDDISYFLPRLYVLGIMEVLCNKVISVTWAMGSIRINSNM